MHRTSALSDVLELAALERPRWNAMSAALRAADIPLNDGEPEPTPTPTPTPEPAKPEPTPTFTPPTEDEWKAMQQERDDAKQSAADSSRAKRDAEKALEKATGKGETAEQKLTRVSNAVAKSALDEAIEEQAKALNFRSPKLAKRLIERQGLEADVDLDGDEVKATVADTTKAAIKSRLEEVLEEDEELASQGRPAQLGGAGQGDQPAGGGNASMNDAIRRAAGRG